MQTRTWIEEDGPRKVLTVFGNIRSYVDKEEIAGWFVGGCRKLEWEHSLVDKAILHVHTDQDGELIVYKQCDEEGDFVKIYHDYEPYHRRDGE